MRFDEDWLRDYTRRTGCAVVGGLDSRRTPAKPVERATALVETHRPSALVADPSGPLVVRLVRQGGRTMDQDGLAASFKPVRDAVAAAFGRASDAEAEGWTWEYEQRKGPRGVIVEVRRG